MFNWKKPKTKLIEDSTKRLLIEGKYFFDICKQYFSPLIQAGFNSKQETDRDGTHYFELSSKHLRINFVFNIDNMLNVNVGPNAIGTMRRKYELMEIFHEIDGDINLNSLPFKKGKWGYELKIEAPDLDNVISIIACQIQNHLIQIQSIIQKKVEKDDYFGG